MPEPTDIVSSSSFSGPTVGDYITGRLTCPYQALGLVLSGSAIGAGVRYRTDEMGKYALIGALSGLGVHVIASVVTGCIQASR